MIRNLECHDLETPAFIHGRTTQITGPIPENMRLLALSNNFNVLLWGNGSDLIMCSLFDFGNSEADYENVVDELDLNEPIRFLRISPCGARLFVHTGNGTSYTFRIFDLDSTGFSEVESHLSPGCSQVYQVEWLGSTCVKVVSSTGSVWTIEPSVRPLKSMEGVQSMGVWRETVGFYVKGPQIWNARGMVANLMDQMADPGDCTSVWIHGDTLLLNYQDDEGTSQVVCHLHSEDQLDVVGQSFNELSSNGSRGIGICQATQSFAYLGQTSSQTLCLFKVQDANPQLRLSFGTPPDGKQLVVPCNFEAEDSEDPMFRGLEIWTGWGGETPRGPGLPMLRKPKVFFVLGSDGQLSTFFLDSEDGDLEIGQPAHWPVSSKLPEAHPKELIYYVCLRIYQLYNPERIDDLWDRLSKYAGKEDRFLKKVVCYYEVMEETEADWQPPSVIVRNVEALGTPAQLVHAVAEKLGFPPYFTPTEGHGRLLEILARFEPCRIGHLENLLKGFGNAHRLQVDLEIQYGISPESPIFCEYYLRLKTLYQSLDLAGPDLVALLRKYQGKEHGVYEKACLKYGQTPEPPSFDSCPPPSYESIVEEYRVACRTTGFQMETEFPSTLYSHYLGRLYPIYAQYNPQKIGELPFLLLKYHLKEHGLYQKVCQKYGCSIQPPYTSQVYEEYFHRLTCLYSKHNPAKLSEVSSLLFKYEGKEHGLYTKACTKYGVSPQEVYPSSPIYEYYKCRLTELYTQHNPKKIREIPQLLFKYKSKEHGLYEKACRKYQVAPLPVWPSNRYYEYLRRLTDVFSEYNPQKIPEIPQLLFKYQGKEHGLYEKACDKYGVRPHRPFPSEGYYEFYEDIAQIYAEKLPDRLDYVDHLLMKHKGNEQELYEKVCHKYGVSPRGRGPSVVEEPISPKAEELSLKFPSLNLPKPREDTPTPDLDVTHPNPGQTQDQEETYREYSIKLQHLYEEHAPERLGDIPALLDNNRGREEELFQAEKYRYNWLGPDPQPPDLFTYNPEVPFGLAASRTGLAASPDYKGNSIFGTPGPSKPSVMDWNSKVKCERSPAPTSNNPFMSPPMGGAPDKEKSPESSSSGTNLNKIPTLDNLAALGTPDYRRSSVEDEAAAVEAQNSEKPPAEYLTPHSWEDYPTFRSPPLDVEEELGDYLDAEDGPEDEARQASRGAWTKAKDASDPPSPMQTQLDELWATYWVLHEEFQRDIKEDQLVGGLLDGVAAPVKNGLMEIRASLTSLNQAIIAEESLNNRHFKGTVNVVKEALQACEERLVFLQKIQELSDQRKPNFPKQPRGSFGINAGLLRTFSQELLVVEQKLAAQIGEYRQMRDPLEPIKGTYLRDAVESFVRPSATDRVRGWLSSWILG